MKDFEKLQKLYGRQKDKEEDGVCPKCPYVIYVLEGDVRVPLKKSCPLREYDKRGDTGAVKLTATKGIPEDCSYLSLDDLDVFD